MTKNSQAQFDADIRYEIDRLYKTVTAATKAPELPPYRYGVLTSIRQMLEQLSGSAMLLTGDRERARAAHAGEAPVHTPAGTP